MGKSKADRNRNDDGHHPVARHEKSKDEQRPAVKDIKKSPKIKGDESHDKSSSNQYSNAKQATDISQPSSRILESNTNQHPFFYYQNQTNSQSHYFSLHSNPNNHNNDSTLYRNYGTTLTVIIVLHLIYFYQWNTRRSRQHVCTSYEQLVEKKQFYRALVAIASHPPVDGGERDTTAQHGMVEGGEINSSGASLQNARTFLELYVSFRLCDRISDGISPIIQRILPFFTLIRQRILHPLIYGSLSGLPLLTFASHILWQCRALEELYDVHGGELILGVSGNDVNVTQFSGIGTAATKIQIAGDAYDTIDKHVSSSGDGYTYFRVLVALALTSMLLELSLLRSILKQLERTMNFDGYTTTPHQLLSQRAMCSIASLTTALLGVYDSHFPYAPPPVLPFVHVSSSGFSLIYSVLILTILTHRIHPVTSIISGLLSGSLWSLGFTSFLGTRYWGNIMLFSLALVIFLSLKAQPSYSMYMEMFCPCIDYVMWDREGEIPDGSASSSQNVYRQNSTRGGISQTNSDDLEMGTQFQTQNGGHHGEERFPLLSSQSSTMSGGSSSVIRGRVPLINTMESEDGAGDLVGNNEESMPSASSRFGASLSRRAGGSGIQ